MTFRRTVLLMVFPLAGCSLWNDYDRPKTDAPEAWTTPAAKTAWPDADWWKQFHSDALTAQVEQAQKENFDIAAAIARVREADAQMRIAGAALLPSVDAEANATRTRTGSSRTNTTILGTTSRTNIANSYNGTLNASYELDFWGKNWAAEESARALADASRYDKETITLTTLSAVANTYFDIIATQERLKIGKDNLANAQQTLDAFKKRFDQGIASMLDVSQQENAVATQAAALPPLQQRLQQDLDAQAILLGKLPEGTQADTATIEAMNLPEIGAGLPSELLERRPDVQNAEAQLISANANITGARAQFFPSIGLTAQGGYASSALSQLFKSGGLLWSIGGNAVQPIFEGGALEGNLELAHAQYDEQLAVYRKSVVSAFSDVEDALVAAQQAAEEEKAQAAAQASAKTAYDLSQQQLQGGIIDITTMLNTQRTLFAADDLLIQAKLAHMQAVVGVYKALGGGWKAGAGDTQNAPQQTPADTKPKPVEAPANPDAQAAPVADTPATPAALDAKAPEPTSAAANDAGKESDAGKEGPAAQPAKPETSPPASEDKPQ